MTGGVTSGGCGSVFSGPGDGSGPVAAAPSPPSGRSRAGRPGEQSAVSSGLFPPSSITPPTTAPMATMYRRRSSAAGPRTSSPSAAPASCCASAVPAVRPRTRRTPPTALAAGFGGAVTTGVIATAVPQPERGGRVAGGGRGHAGRGPVRGEFVEPRRLRDRPAARDRQPARPATAPPGRPRATVPSSASTPPGS